MAGQRPAPVSMSGRLLPPSPPPSLPPSLPLSLTHLSHSASLSGCATLALSCAAQSETACHACDIETCAGSPEQGRLAGTHTHIYICIYIHLYIYICICICIYILHLHLTSYIYILHLHLHLHLHLLPYISFYIYNMRWNRCLLVARLLRAKQVSAAEAEAHA